MPLSITFSNGATIFLRAKPTLSKALPLIGRKTLTESLEQMLADYEVWLERQPLAENTRRLPSLEDRERAMEGLRVDD